MEKGIHIALAPEVITTLWGVPITGTLIMSYVVIFFLITIAALVGRHLKLIPGKIQTVFEWAISFTLDYMGDVLENRELARRVFPIIASVFLFILVGNMIEFTPGIGSVGFFHGDRPFAIG